MALKNKIDSNDTELRYAEETSIGVLPGSPEWVPLDPNSYRDFGGNLTLLARRPISSDRQRKKGVISDLDSAGGFNIDFTQTNIQKLLQGFFFADLREKDQFGGGTEITNIDGTNDEFDAASGLDIFAVGDLVFAKGFTNAVNNGLHEVDGLTGDTALSVTTDLVDETPPSGAQLDRVGVIAGTADLDVDISGSYPAITSTTLDFTTLGLIPGEWIFVGGDATANKFASAVNNGFKRVKSVAANTLTLDKSDSAMVAETGTGLDIQLFFGRVLKNESASADITRRTYNLERNLGQPDDASSNTQYEYVEGAVASELTFNVASADKLNADLSFVGIDYTTNDSTTGAKTGTRPSLDEEDAFNTSSDFSRIKIYTITDGDEAPSALFAFLSEMSLAVNNNVSPNKAIGTLGAFEITAGIFAVSGSMTAYFADVAAVEAVRANSDVTMDMITVKDNKGVAIDLPLIALGDGRLNVEQDQPITLPISHEAATGAKIDSAMDHTLLMTFFDYLPDDAAA